MDKKEKNFKRWITIISIAVPLVVMVLFRVRLKNVEPLHFLPPIYAAINGLTAVLLVCAVWAIKKGNRKRHQQFINVCITLSLLFLLMYIGYHMTSDPTPFGGDGWLKVLYYFILVSHIILSVAVIPLVLHTYSQAYLGKFESHRKWAKYTFPVWLYVAVTGVLVYFMISPYYL